MNFPEIFKELLAYLKNPQKKINELPDWDWQTLGAVHLLLAVSSGVAEGIVARKFYQIIGGIIFTPILYTFTLLVFGLGLYYVILYYFGKEVSVRRLLTVLVMANIPFLIFQILTPLFSLITLAGFFFSSMILIVGLVNNFSLPRKEVAYLIFGFYTLAFVFEIWGKIKVG